MVFNLFRKSKNDDFLKPPIQVEPTPDTSGPGRMTIEDVFKITGRGTVVTGRVESGSFHVGQKVTITTTDSQISTTITGVETFRKRLDSVTAGDIAGLVLANVDHKSVQHGNIITSE